MREEASEAYSESTPCPSCVIEDHPSAPRVRGERAKDPSRNVELPPVVALSIKPGPDDDSNNDWNAILGGMEGTKYRVMLSGSDRYYVELTRQGESSCTTSDFVTQSAAQDWIDQDREREGALDRRWQVASRRWPWWMHLWWRS